MLRLLQQTLLVWIRATQIFSMLNILSGSQLSSLAALDHVEVVQAMVAVEKRISCSNLSAEFSEQKLQKKTIPFHTTLQPQLSLMMTDRN